MPLDADVGAIHRASHGLPRIVAQLRAQGCLSVPNVSSVACNGNA
jgi:hypothetical protein